MQFGLQAGAKWRQCSWYGRTQWTTFAGFSEVRELGLQIPRRSSTCSSGPLPTELPPELGAALQITFPEASEESIFWRNNKNRVSN
jgi:hypothetical protein